MRVIGRLLAPLLRRAGKLPQWARLVVGAVCTVVGAVLTVRPFTSLATLVLVVGIAMIATGISELVDARREFSRHGALLGIAWLVLGVIVFAVPGVTIGAMRWVVGIAMIVTGVWRAATAIRDREELFPALLSGMASVIFGALALTWPDVTVLVIAVLFGARTILTGLLLLTTTLFPKYAERRAMTDRPHRAHVLRSAGALLVALVLVATSVALHRASPTVDAFYNAPAQIPAGPGKLVRSEPFSRGIPDNAQAWRILYTTTTTDGSPTLASAIVVLGRGAPAGPRPVLAWAHGTTGYARNCAPSLQKDPLGSGAMPDLDQVIANHWLLVATDYAGMGTAGVQPYLIGSGEARSVLDSVRAVRQLRDVSAAKQTVVWGHSQGGGAALWTGQLQPSYAPDVPLAGVAAMAPASDLTAFADTVATVPGGMIFMSYVIKAYAGTYRDVRESHYVRRTARATVDAAAVRCLSEPSMLISAATSLGPERKIMSQSPDSGSLRKRLQENTSRGTGTTPLLIAQGASDTLIPPSMQRSYARDLCAHGGRLDYREYAGNDHVGVVSQGSPLLPELITWTRHRLAGEPQTGNCSSL